MISVYDITVQVLINIGIFLCSISNYFFKLHLNLGWCVMLIAGSILSVVLPFELLTMLESPKWFIMQGHLGSVKCILTKTSNSKEEAAL